MFIIICHNMAYAVLICEETSNFFPTKTLKLEEGIPQTLGRVFQNNESVVNGLFETFHLEVCCQHASLLYARKQFFLEDTSINGTYVNGQRINKNSKFIIISGDIIQLGGESFSIPDIDFHPITFSVKLFAPEDAEFVKKLLQTDIYDTPLQLYRTLPNFEYSLSLLYQSVINRFEALKILEILGNANNLNEKLINCALHKYSEIGLRDIIKLIRGTSGSYEEEYKLQEMDHVSYFVLCIASCRNHVMKKWFLEQEKKLLLLRWNFLTRHEKFRIISKYFSYLNEVGEDEITNVSKTSNGIIDPSLKYYKVFFTVVSELMAKRNIFVKGGIGYVELADLVYAIKNDFTKHLQFNLESIKKNLHKIWNDERIISIISYVEKEVQFERFLFGRRSSSVMLKEIDILAEESFPLCMNVLHFNLKKKKHLKNSGRFQYGLFLKGIGLSLKDSQTFWRSYFTKKMSLKEFMKHYNYHIFHLYGAIGKKADYPPQSCKKIFQAVPTFSEYHGCPFKLYDEENMCSLLKRQQINDGDMNHIFELMKNDMPQLACSKYFEIKHGSPLGEAVFHPNIYFEESRNLLKNKTELQSRNLNIKKLPQNHSASSSASKTNAIIPCCNSVYEW